MAKKCLLIIVLAFFATGVFAQASVKIWQEEVEIPTYRLNTPDQNPMFYTHESYQGAEKRIYPYPMQDGVTDIRKRRKLTRPCTWKMSTSGFQFCPR